MFKPTQWKHWHTAHLHPKSPQVARRWNWATQRNDKTRCHWISSSANKSDIVAIKLLLKLPSQPVQLRRLTFLKPAMIKREESPCKANTKMEQQQMRMTILNFKTKEEAQISFCLWNDQFRERVPWHHCWDTWKKNWYKKQSRWQCQTTRRNCRKPWQHSS